MSVRNHDNVTSYCLLLAIIRLNNTIIIILKFYHAATLSFTQTFTHIYTHVVTGFMLKGRRYIENELVALDQIEENDGALLCLTTNLSCCSSTFTSSNKGIGEWYFPNDTTVPIKSQSHTAYRNRGNGTLRLNVKRTKERVPSDLEGIFTCEIPDGQGVMRNLTIAIFSRERGRSLSTPYVISILFSSTKCVQ